MTGAYKMTIGLEVHAQLRTKTKMFCGCAAVYGAEVNANTCPVCLGLPGALPAPNRAAIGMAIRVGLALGCSLAQLTKFDRKNYFYPDLPKGYQISQFDQPLCQSGSVTISGGWGSKKVGITRIHLEEDAGKSLHDYSEGTLIDLNRCGTPLIEIVSEPDLYSPEEAYAYLMEIRRLVRWLDVCDGNLEEGSLRCDANISVSLLEGNRGTPVEIKNLNSFHGVERALKYEAQRQSRQLEQGRQVSRETRLWDAAKGETRVMRTKEQAHDYRYFPEPDLVEIQVDAGWVDRERKAMSELPWTRFTRYLDAWQVKPADGEILTAAKDIGDYFEQVVAQCGDPLRAVRWVVGEGMRWRKELGGGERFPFSSGSLAQLIKLEASGTVSTSAAKTVLEVMAREDRGDPKAILSELGLEIQSDEVELEQIVNGVMDTHPREVGRYRAGEKKLLGFLMGQVMQKTGGKADPKKASAILVRALSKQED